jgi:D-aminopeptidase
MVAGVHVMGGAPGTRETDLLRPDATVPAVDALVLSGGSAFGLAAADGVIAALSEEGRGFPAAGHRVPIAPTAILFDLAAGGGSRSTGLYPSLGHAAVAARGRHITLGSKGAGTGATVAGLKGGVGSASAVLPSGITVGALVAVNALGEVTHGPDGRFWAAHFEEGAEFGGLGPVTDLAGPPRTKLSEFNTTIGVVATDAKLDKAGATRLAIAAHDGLARAIVPSHTPLDGDLVFAASTGQCPLDETERVILGHVAATCLARAVARGVYHARSAEGDPFPAWSDLYA